MDDLSAFLKNADQECAVFADEILNKTSFEATPFKSAELVKEESRLALIDVLTAKDVRSRLERGFSILSRELIAYETPHVMQEIRAEWIKYSDFVMSQITSKGFFEEENSPISEATLRCFYKHGLRLYENKIFQEAADVFFVISFIDKRRHNVWMALGLSEKSLNHYEEALTGFSMAILTNKESVFPFIHSAECYIALGEKADAEECIKAGLDLVKDKSDEESICMSLYIRSLKI